VIELVSEYLTTSQFWADVPEMKGCDITIRNQKVTLGFKINDALSSIFGQQSWITLYGEIHYFNGSVYKMKTIDELTTIIEKWWGIAYPDTFFIKHGVEVYNRLKLKNNITLDLLNIPVNLVPFKNGYFDLDTQTFQYGCSSKYHFTDGFDFEYKPISKSAHWLDKPILFLYHIHQMFPNNPTIQNEILTSFCYTMTEHIDYQLGFVLLGKSNCGKSTLMEIGQDLVGSTQFKDFCPLNFDKKEKEIVIGTTQGAKIVNCDEIESSAYWSSEVVGGLKHLITTHNVTGRKLFKNETKTINKSHVWITANYLPRLYSYDDGICRRWLCWFSNESYMHSKDLDRRKDIIKFEREKLINYLFTNHSNFNILLNFDEEFNKDFWQKYASNMYAFMRDMCVLEKDVSITFDSLYKAYCEYCECAVSKEKPLSGKYFGQYLHRYGVKSMQVGHDKIYMYDGIKLKQTEFGDVGSDGVTTGSIGKFNGFNDLIKQR
jgi:phage/plasmid-associated DNA primase